MDTGADDISGFLAARHPFDLLPAGERAALAACMSARTLAAGAVLMNPGDQVDRLSLVRHGALETRSPDGELLARLGEGDAAGIRSLLSGGRAVNRITALEDTLLFDLPAAAFHRLRGAYPAVNYFFAPQGADRLRGARAAAGWDSQAALVGRRVGELVRREPVTVGPDASIAEAARLMLRSDVSCLPVVADGRLLGILTDRDLRNRVLAAGMDPSSPVAVAMTPGPKRVEETAFLFQAQILLARHRIHHLPVMRGDRLLGLVTSTDLLRSQVRSAVFLAGDVGEREDADGIAAALKPLPDVMHDMVQGGVGAYAIGHAISALADAATVRLVELAERKLGPPPVPYGWMALGSQGREEQTARSDQDNALVLDDSYDEAGHGPWFAAFADFVCDGLARAGYVHCPGGIMAKNPSWRMSLSGWKDTFRRWIRTPHPEALLNSSVFFDMRPVAGRLKLVQELQETVVAQAKGQGLFLGHMAGNAVAHQPPLGFFRNLVLISGGEHHRSLDLKHSGLAPIVDLARLYALDAGVPQVNSHDRLLAAAEAGAVSRSGAKDLADALEFLGTIRLRHQALRLREGKPPDNYLSPEELSPFERGHLKDAFAVVKAMQQAALSAYRGGRA